MDLSSIVNIFDKYGWPGMIAVIIVIACIFVWKLWQSQKKTMTSSLDNIATNITTSIQESNKNILTSISSQNEALNKSISEQNATLVNSINTQNDKLISYFLNGKQEAHDKGMDKRWDVSEEIDREITDLLNVSHASRVSILELHNGEVNLERLPFLKYSMFYEHTARGIAGIDDTIKGRDASQLRVIVKKLHNENCNFVCLNKDDIIQMYDASPRLSDALQKLGLSYVIYCGLYSKTNRILGLLSIEYTKEFPQDIIEKYKQHYIDSAQRIELYLQYDV